MELQFYSILVADDDEGDRKQIKRCLKKAGIDCDIIEAEDIAEALGACEQKAFDCMILDYQLPGQSSLHSIKIFKDMHPYMPIVMVTGQGDEMVAAEAFKLGISDYLPKSFMNEESLKQVLKNATEKMLLRRKIVDQQEEMEKFTHVLAHDLKAPIRHIRMLGDLVSKSIESEKYEDAVRFQSQVTDAAERMDELIDALTTYNKVLGGDVEFKPTSMESVIKAAIDNLSVIIKENEAQVTYDALPDVTCNEPQLIQLFQNLIGNGIKYCTMPPPKVHISAEQQGDHYVIAVKDNGIGIPERFLKTVFEPFRRLHSPGEFSGTGLGLATCHKIVKRHKGDIWCESAEGKGSTFYIKLGDASLKDKEEDSAAPTEQEMEGIQFNAKVLVAEDFRPYSEMATKMLTKLGCSVDVVQDGESAVDKLEEVSGAYDLVFMDWQMPLMDGIEATQVIRTKDWGKNLKIIALTGAEITDDRERCIEAGMNDYIKKPMTTAKLLNIASQYLSEKKVV